METIKLHLIGDSISIHYTPYLIELLNPKIQFSRKGGDADAFKNLDTPTGSNGGDSSMVLSYLKEILNVKSNKYDVIAFNCGLHDIKRPSITNELQISLADYKKNLSDILDLIFEHKIRPIWITTTHVDEKIHNSKSNNFRRLEKDHLDFKNASAEIMTKRRVDIIDLYAFTLTLSGQLFMDHVHFSENIRKKQAEFISQELEKITLLTLN